MRGKTPIGGREITKEQLLKGLPNPKKWKEFSDRVYAKFRAKPQADIPVIPPLVKIKHGLAKLDGFTRPSRPQIRYAKSNTSESGTKFKKMPAKKKKSQSRRSGGKKS
jgi:hypothetical protein